MKVLCLDSNSILNRAYYGVKPLTTRDGIPTNAIYGFMNILGKLLNETNPDAVMFAFDLKAKTFRHQMYEEYKANRKGMPEDLAQQLPLIKELLTYLGYTIVTKEGYEADDILGTFSQKCEEKGYQCYIATGDRDSLQLIEKNTTVLLATTKMGKPETIHFDLEKFRTEYGTEPKGLIDIKALMGDSSDNIPGVDGIGEKTAQKLISEYNNIETIYQKIDELDVKEGIRKKLKAGEESAFLSKKLATIDREVPLEISPEDCIPKPRSEGEAFALLTRLEMSSIIKKLDLKDCGISTINSVPKEENIVGNVEFTEEISFENAENIAVFPILENGEISEIAVESGNKISIISANSTEIMEKILQNAEKIITFDSKNLYRWAFQRNLSVNLVKEDILLSAYILSADSKSYEIENLLSQYSSRNIEITGEFDEKYKNILEQTAKFSALSQSLRKEICKNNQEFLLDKIEIPLAKVLASMEILGVEIDAEALEEFGKMLDEKISDTKKIIHNLAGEEFNVNSPKQLGEILFEKLGLPARKKTKTGYSTNAEILEELTKKHPIIPNILEYRHLAKLKSTYVEGLAKVISADGRIHSHFNQTDTRTGRLSSSEPNLQNIPVRTELGAKMRCFFRAKNGCKFVDADYSQIELRVLAHIADDKTMQSAFNSGEDIHTNTAAQVFDLPPLFVTPDMRRKAKAVNFGIVYGIGAFSLAQDIGVSVAEADKYIKNYLETFSGVKEYMDKTIKFGEENGYVKTLYERRRPLPELKSSNKNILNAGKRIAMNTPIQGTAADIIKIAMIKVYERLERENKKSRLILQIHDELIVETAEDEEAEVLQLVKEEMEAAAELKVKLSVDAHSGKTWYEAK